ncbi:SDR family oxidoreductase [Microbacterium sp. LWH13-1.2]|uniref:SDR family NAD(P)-dependent oxidoreductase n=1 Tax=Microbacterium sp. LWH13-1.2 TaxID=3135260 RepID=UPI003139BF3A
MKLQDRTAIVTGGGRGIGREIALGLAREGARVVVNDLDAGPADETVALIQALGGAAAASVGSITDADAPDRIVDTAVSHFGGLDIIVNNAGYTWDSVIQKTGDDQWEEMVALHLTAPFRLLRAAQPVFAAAAKAELAETGGARCRKVVNVSSVSALSGNPGQVAYSSAKAGISGLTHTLAREWGRYNVTVNAVAFGLIATRLTTPADDDVEIDVAGSAVRVGVNRAVLDRAKESIPLGRVGTPVDAAGAVLLLCLPESDYVTGETLVCGGGWRG